MSPGRKFLDSDRTKRAADLVVASLAMVALAPVTVAVALAVRLRLGAPVVFSQVRPGQHGVPFKLYKFRSMLNVDEDAGLVTNEQRMTSFGRRLRASSLDELPSLWNVVKGEMSLVGPRPLRMEYLPRYDRRQVRRHEVRPGVTGLAQVSGRNALSWADRLELDVQYVESRTMRMDVAIVRSTIGDVLRRQGVQGDGLSAMSAFMGTADDSGLTETPLAERWLPLRVAWLSDPAVSRGVTLTFAPDIDATRRWWAVVAQDSTRRDWVYLDPSGDPVAMCGFAGVGGCDLSLYLYVDPGRHGQGYGRRALHKMIVRAESLGARRLRLEVKSANGPAVALYRGMGFTPEGAASSPEKIAMVRLLGSAAAVGWPS